jgi:hypothetical protein
MMQINELNQGKFIVILHINMPYSDIKKASVFFSPISLGEMDDVRLMDRVDTKFVLSVGVLSEVMNKMNGQYRILEINGERVFHYLSTYLDTSDFVFFNEHATCRPIRNKVRYRKYESTGLSFLEIKRKTNKNRTIKWRIPGELNPGSPIDNIAADFIEENIPGKSLLLNPVLINSFKRITFVGAFTAERLTLDYDILFTDMNGNVVNMPHVAIIEVKREENYSCSPVVKILKDILIRPCGFSKYCVGSSMLHDLPRKNMFKSKYLLINKIENGYAGYYNS